MAESSASTFILSKRGGILIVEDDYIIADDMVQALKAIGIEVVGPVASVKAALALITERGPLDGAVLDVDLQGEMVFPVADELVRRGVPFLFATGHNAAVVPDRFAHVPYCEKPIDMARMVQLLLA